MNGRLILYDTSNYVNFPIGGQLTSINNFLRYMINRHPDKCENIVLVGVTTDESRIGCWQEVEIYGKKLKMFPVAKAEINLGDVKKSLRLEFVKGLLKHGKKLRISAKDCNYIHTPESYGVVKVLCPRAKCVIYSHGSYFNMEKGFRFFQNNLLIKKGFMLYIKWILKNANTIFVLDEDSKNRYTGYNKNVILVSNSIVRPPKREAYDIKSQIIYAGRLSKDKNIGPIMQAVKNMPMYRLVVLGDGEEYAKLKEYEADNVHMMGAVEPGEVKKYLMESDILVMNSLFEGVPMVILEALSYGIPVVTTPVGGIPSVLSFGRDSEETDASALGIESKIKRIYADYETYARNAYEKSAKYDYLCVNEKIYSELEKVWN